MVDFNNDFAEDIIKDVAREDTVAWMEGYGRIQVKNGDIVRPKCNEYQRKISEVIKYAKRARRPCRIVALKPRQKGSSTVGTAAGYVRMKQKRARGCIAGGKHSQGENLFKMVRIYGETDELDPRCCKVMDAVVRFTNGSTLERITLATPHAGRSGTYQFLLITEVAYLAEEGVANADKVMDGLLKCVPYEPDTIIIEESTANGAQGKFYETWEKGITFEEFKAGRNGRVKIFAAWFEFEDSTMSPESEEIYSFDDLERDEREYAEKWGLRLDQVAWMRWAIREECGGDWDKFKQDYPSDPESAFLLSGRPCFSAAGLDYQEEQIKLAKPRYGVLEYNKSTDRVSFRETREEEASVVMLEEPRVGCDYITPCDPATGDSQTSGEDPDSNAFGVLRRGYLDSSQKWHQPAVAMLGIHYKDGTRFGNYWDTDILEFELYKMAKFYGGCPIVVEVNKDRGIIELLKLRPDADIYVREQFNRRTNETTEQLGWLTDAQTREMIITGLKRAVREAGKGKPNEGILFNCPWILREAKTFIIRANGRSEAAPRKHDDLILFLAIGLHCIDKATRYALPVRAEYVPEDLRLSDRRYHGGRHSPGMG